MEEPKPKYSIISGIAATLFGVLIAMDIRSCNKSASLSDERIEYIKSVEYQNGFVDGYRAHEDGSILLQEIGSGPKYSIPTKK